MENITKPEYFAYMYLILFWRYITKTCPCNIQRFVLDEKIEILLEKICFFIFSLKTYIVGIHNVCFENKRTDLGPKSVRLITNDTIGKEIGANSKNGNAIGTNGTNVIFTNQWCH